MAKNPNRVAAGKRAWAAKTQAAKNKILAALRRGRAKSTGRAPARTPAARSQSPSRGGSTGNPAKKRNGQSAINFVDNLLTAGIALTGVWDAIRAAQVNPGREFQAFADRLVENYSGVNIGLLRGNKPNFKIERLARGYVPMGAAVLRHKTGAFLKRAAPIRSKQGIMSKATSYIARLMHMTSPLLRAKEALDSRLHIARWGFNTSADYTAVHVAGRNLDSVKLDLSRLAVGHGPTAGGWALKKATSELSRAVPLKMPGALKI